MLYPLFLTTTAITYDSLAVHHTDFSRPPASLARGDIAYRYGKKVLAGTNVTIYNIFYGDFTEAQKTVVETFSKGVGASNWWDITNKYYYQENAAAEKVYVTDGILLGKSVQDNYSKGKSLKDNNLPEIIQAQIDAGNLPEDDNAVYFVITAKDVKEKIRSDLGNAAFCSQYCGYHVSWKLRSGKRIFYSMVGLPSNSCLSGCAPRQNQRKSPNNDPALDAMISVFAHELTEAVTDPISDIGDERAWEDDQRLENADKCRGFGKTFTSANGATANMIIGGTEYMVQQNWDPVAQTCVSS
jgi:hypothetical protein